MALCQEGKLGAVQSGHKRASRSRRRSRSSSRHRSRMPGLRDWSGHSCCSPPNMPPRCHCRELLSPSANTMPKLPWPSIIWPMPSLAARLGVWPGPPLTIMCHVVRQDGGSRGELAMERMEASRGSPTWQSIVQVDIGEQEPKTLEEIDPHWRATQWLQVAVQGITEEEVPWYKLVTPLTSGVEGMALSPAKRLVAVWWWNVKVHGEDDCPPAPSVLNIGQFIMDEEVAGGMGEPHWFMAYSHALQQVGEAAHGRKWEWPRRNTMEIKASLLVHAFWCKTGVDLTVASIKLCWEPTPRALYHQRDNGPTTHIISYLDKLAVHAPTLEEWDQMVWPTVAAIPRALTEAELYGYTRGQAVDLSPVMLVAQFQVTEEGGAYLCTARALVFQGSILVYNPALNEAEWVPVHGLANDLSWAEERSAVALVNYVPCGQAEVAQIARLGAGRIVSEDGASRQTNPGDAVERDQQQPPWNSEAIMEEAKGLAYDDPRSDSDALVMGADGSQGPGLSLHYEAANSPPNTPRSLALCMPGLPIEHMPLLEATVTGGDVVKVHVDKEELNNL